MKTAFFAEPRKIVLSEEPMPRLDRADAVLVRIERLGICGSDVHYFVEGGIGGLQLTYPATLGHECAGTIVEIGNRVTHLKPGDRVAIDPAIACGRCDQCRIGRTNTCRDLQFMGSPGEAEGAAAEYRVLPATNCHRLPDGVSLDEAALVEPLSIGLHAVRSAELSQTSKTAVLGAGPIGLSVLLCAKATAACSVCMTDLLDPRLAIAKRCGADWTGNAKDSKTQENLSHQRPIEPHISSNPRSTNGRPVCMSKQRSEVFTTFANIKNGFDVVFECSGDPACIDQAIDLLTPGGTLAVVGIPVVERVAIDIHALRRKELTVKNVRRQLNCFVPAIELLASKRMDARPLITHRFPLERIAEAFELVAGYRDGVVKAMIDIA